ncbi:MAG: homoaconitase [Ignavibacteriales bacterium]|nr:homoaconitase [Ignavibacteriales bacterium]
MPQNMIEKIAASAAVGVERPEAVRAGDFITAAPAYVMTHDNTGAVIPKFKGVGATKLANPRQVVITLDHNIQDTSEKNLEKYRKIQTFAEEMGADFYPAGRGIGHQIMCEEGYAFPGTTVVASDSHSNMYGGLGCYGTPVVRTDAAAIWATGETWRRIPPVVKVELTGSLKPGVTGKDVIVALCGYFNNDEVLNHAVEFAGEGVATLGIESRLTIANMTTEWGALAGVFPIDAETISWLKRRIEIVERRGPAGVPSDVDGAGVNPRLNHVRVERLEKELERFQPDPDAFYAKTIVVDLASVEPLVAGPNSVKTVAPVSRLREEKIPVHKAYLVSCVNSRLEDVAEAAKIVRGKKIAEGVEMYIAAASDEVERDARRLGYWDALLAAGAKELPPGCGPCIGLGAGLLEPGETGISATNRNFKGRMGSPDAKAYLASPAVVAASAVAGYIDYPGELAGGAVKAALSVNDEPERDDAASAIVEGFPKTIEGEIVFCHADNLNTDGVYPGKYTYQDDMTPDAMANVAMENYDPAFQSIAASGDVIVGGFNFGTGSSREQAATALKYFGIKTLVAGSLSETYARNAINNGFVVFAAPKLVRDLKARFGTDKPTVKTGLALEADFEKSVVRVDGETYRVSPFGKPAQEVIAAGGLEKWIEKKIKS